MASTTNDKHLVLVGMMGTGKTTVGRLMSCAFNCPFVDSDEYIEVQTGKTVRDIFSERGEPAFRTLESEVLRKAIDAPGGPRVIAAAGGVVIDPANREALKTAGAVVWLRARPDLLAKRVATGTHRPLLDDDAAFVLAKLDEQRRPLYEEVADVVIDVDELSPEEVAEAILVRVER